jgi:hypothetical protein
MVVTLAFNFLADALRDYFDPYHTLLPKFSLKRAFARWTKMPEKHKKSP